MVERTNLFYKKILKIYQPSKKQKTETSFLKFFPNKIKKAEDENVAEMQKTFGAEKTRILKSLKLFGGEQSCFSQFSGKSHQIE